MNTILIIVLGALFLGVLPIWSHSSNWGYLPSSGLGLPLRGSGPSDPDGLVERDGNEKGVMGASARR